MQKQQKTTLQRKTLCIVAGGSGGHITPALQLGKRWLEKNNNSAVVFVGNKKKLDINLVAHEHLSRVVWLKLGNVPGRQLWRYPLFFIQFAIAFCKSFLFLRKMKPDKIVSTGGHIALPVCLAGSLLKIPIELHELNVVPGKAIKFLSSIAHNIFVTFEESKKLFQTKTCTVEGYPLRFSEADKACNKEQIVKTLNLMLEPTQQHLEPTRKTIFLLGGSQGSLFLNNLLKQWIEKQKLHTNIQVIHQTGSVDTTNWKSFYAEQEIPALTFSYYDHIKDCYLLADLIIARGGAGTLFELEFFKKKSIIIPIKTLAGSHQAKNAAVLAARNREIFTLFDQDSISRDFELLNKEITKAIAKRR